MRGKYYINITLRFLFFHLTIMSTGIMYQHNYKYKPLLCTTYYICWYCENELNQINICIVLD